jgi:rhodanese-related sulfurtransferase
VEEYNGKKDTVTMADEPDLSRTEDRTSSADDTIRGEREDEHIAEIVQEELQAVETPTGSVSLANRFKEIVQEAGADAASDNGSTDAIPRRAGSPVDSLPDDTPSVQVCRGVLQSQAVLTQV